MEPSRVLVALEELDRWQARRIRLEEELRTLRARREKLRSELERVKAKVSGLREILFQAARTEAPAVRQPPFQME